MDFSTKIDIGKLEGKQNLSTWKYTISITLEGTDMLSMGNFTDQYLLRKEVTLRLAFITKYTRGNTAKGYAVQNGTRSLARAASDYLTDRLTIEPIICV